MKDRIAPGIPLAIVLSAVVATDALRAAVRRREPQPAPGTEPALVTATAGESRPRPAVTTGTQDGTGHQRAGPPDPPDRPASAVEQMQQVFHELHADGRSALCAVCDGRYGLA
jgi:hypothetical protein